MTKDCKRHLQWLEPS